MERMQSKEFLFRNGIIKGSLGRIKKDGHVREDWIGGRYGEMTRGGLVEKGKMGMIYK